MASVAPVTSRKDLLDFLQLPRRLYHGQPGYVAPLDFERAMLLAPSKSAFFGDNEAMYFLARSGGKVVGRISAQILKETPAQWQCKTGLFGCLDVIDDPLVVSMLLDEAGRWLKARGMKQIRGPFTLSSNGETGLQIDGQSHAPIVMMPWHPSYLSGHVESAGFSPVKDVVSYTLDLKHLRPSDLDRYRFLTVRTDGDLKIRGLDLRHLTRDIQIITKIYNDAWSDNWGFVPISEAESLEMAKSLKTIIQKDMAVIVEQDSIPIAVALWIPNVLELIADMDGKLLPFNWLKFLWRSQRRKYHSCRVILLGVAKSARGKAANPGMPGLMISELIRRSVHHKITQVELGWVLDDNMGLRRSIERIGGKVSRTYRVFEAPISIC